MPDAMTRSRFQSLLIAVLVLAALMRVGFLLFGSVLPVVWDQRLYAGAALGIISYVDDSGVWEPKDELDDRYRFRHYYEKYVDGEDIEFLSYEPQTLTEARGDLYLSGPLYPTVLAAIIYVSPWQDFTVARILGIILDLLALLLLMQIGRRLIGFAGTIITGFIYAIYFPFIFTSATLLLETSTVFLILLAIYFMLRSVEDDSIVRLIVAGIATGLLILNKPTAMLLAIPLGFALWLYARRRWSSSLMVKRLAIYVVPVGLCFFGWLVIASSYFGELTLRDPSYADANLRHATSIVNAGYGLDAVEDDFWTRDIVGDLVADPPGTVGLLITKFGRLWEQPYNDFDYNFVIPEVGIDMLHTVVVFLGLLGLVFWIVRDPITGIWLIILPLYYSGIHVVFHSVSRYVYAAIPMMMLAAGFVLAALFAHLKASDRSRKFVLIAVGLLLIGALLDPSWITVPLGLTLSSALVTIVLIIRAVLLALGAYLLIMHAVADGESSAVTLLSPVVVLLLVVPPMFTTTLARDRWGEFETRLSESAVKAGTRIFIDQPPLVKGAERLVAVIDMQAGSSKDQSFSVYLPDGRRNYVLAKGQLRDYFYVKPAYKHYAALQNKSLGQIRQYAFVFLNTDSTLKQIRNRGYIDIEVAVNEQAEEDNDWIAVYGNRAYGDDSAWIPAMRRTSIERYVERDDPRIRVPVEFLSDSAVSYYIGRTDQDIPPSSDLSPSPGHQTGRYNMFLVHFFPDGRWKVY